MNNCYEGHRCHKIFICPFCAEVWRRNKFKNFCKAYDQNDFFKKRDFFYYVVKPVKFDSLKNNFDAVFKVMNFLRESKKRQKIVFFARFEVSFSKKFGFLPHLNVLVWDELRLYQKFDGLKIWQQKIINDHEKNAKKLAWYILKFNKIGYQKGLIVQKAFNKRRQLLHSNEFNNKTFIDEILQNELDFRFLGVYPVRSRAEVALRLKIVAERKKITEKFRKRLKKIRGKNETSNA